MLTTLNSTLSQLGINFDKLFYYKLGLTLGIIFVLWLFKRLSIRILAKRDLEPTRHYFWRKTISNTYNISILLVIVSFWTETLHVFVTFLGLVAAALVITLKEPMLSLAGRVFILWRQPFVIGNRIEINGIKGDVIDTSLFRFIMVEVGNWVSGEQSTGRIVHIPNRWVFDHSIFNYSHGFHYIWDELHLHITLESDWKKTQKILLEIVQDPHQTIVEAAQCDLKKAKEHYILTYKNLEPISYMRLEEGRILVSLRFLCEPKKRRATEHHLWERILTRLEAEDNIEIVK